MTWAAARIGGLSVRSRRTAIATRPTSADVEFRRPLVTGRDALAISEQMKNKKRHRAESHRLRTEIVRYAHARILTTALTFF